jgi:hypothetical protein
MTAKRRRDPNKPADAERAVSPRVLSCGPLLRIALLLAGLFLLARAAGFRRHVDVLSGTGGASAYEGLCGRIYVALHLSFVVLVPVLVIASAILKGLALVLRRGRTTRAVPGRTASRRSA